MDRAGATFPSFGTPCVLTPGNWREQTHSGRFTQNNQAKTSLLKLARKCGRTDCSVLRVVMNKLSSSGIYISFCVLLAKWGHAVTTVDQF